MTFRLIQASNVGPASLSLSWDHERFTVPFTTFSNRGDELYNMGKPSRIDRIKDKTERVKELFTLRGKDEDGCTSSSATQQAQELRNSHSKIHPDDSFMI